MPIRELKEKLSASGWEFQSACAVKTVNISKETLDILMPRVYEMTGLDKYELFIEDLDDSITTDPGEIIFDYTCWNDFRARNADSETRISRTLEILCNIEDIVGNIQSKS